MRWRLMVVLLVALVVAACSAPPQVIRVELSDFAIRPKRVEVKAGSLVRLEVVNWARQPHDLVVRGIDEAATYRLKPLRYEVVEFRAPLEPGIYQMVCTVAGHTDAGQVGQFVVTKPGKPAKD